MTSLESVFENVDWFYLDLSEWDVSNVGDFRNTFKDATYYNGNISTWDMSSATDLTNMFLRSSSFNGDISNWNVEKVTDLGGTFYNASAFNQDISSWNVQKTDWYTADIHRRAFPSEVEGIAGTRHSNPAVRRRWMIAPNLKYGTLSKKRATNLLDFMRTYGKV